MKVGETMTLKREIVDKGCIEMKTKTKITGKRQTTLTRYNQRKTGCLYRKEEETGCRAHTSAPRN
jgi:hypothetical protein